MWYENETDTEDYEGEGIRRKDILYREIRLELSRLGGRLQALVHKPRLM